MEIVNTIIELENITKKYNFSKKNEMIVLNNISLSIKKGEFISIIGKSGSGKTTLLSIISCLDKATEGNVFFEGKNINLKNDREITKIRSQKIGFVFQDFNLMDTLNAFENIEIPLIYQKKKRNERKRIIHKYAQELGISERLKHKPNELSGGEKQRVAIARALVTDPDIIIADEPTGALDKTTGKQILDIFKSLNKQGKTIILVTHDSDIAKLAKRMITLSDGKIIKDICKE